MAHVERRVLVSDARPRDSQGDHKWYAVAYSKNRLRESQKHRSVRRARSGKLLVIRR